MEGTHWLQFARCSLKTQQRLRSSHAAACGVPCNENNRTHPVAESAVFVLVSDCRDKQANFAGQSGGCFDMPALFVEERECLWSCVCVVRRIREPLSSIFGRKGEWGMFSSDEHSPFPLSPENRIRVQEWSSSWYSLSTKKFHFKSANPTILSMIQLSQRSPGPMLSQGIFSRSWVCLVVQEMILKCLKRRVSHSAKIKGFPDTQREWRSWSHTNANPLVLRNKDGDLGISDSGTCQRRQAQEKTAYRKVTAHCVWRFEPACKSCVCYRLGTPGFHSDWVMLHHPRHIHHL